MQKRCPDAEFYYIEGNHEERLESKIIELVAGHATDAEYMRRLWSPQVVLNLEKRGIPYFRMTENHMSLRHKGVIELGNCYFVHGKSHATHTAAVHLRQHSGNVVFGHVHRMQNYNGSDPKKEFGAWCPGCLCELEPIWMHGKPSDWIHGYAIQLVTGTSKSDNFLHVNVPIIDGQSLLGPFVKALDV